LREKVPSNNIAKEFGELELSSG